MKAEIINVYQSQSIHDKLDFYLEKHMGMRSQGFNYLLFSIFSSISLGLAYLGLISSDFL